MPTILDLLTAPGSDIENSCGDRLTKFLQLFPDIVSLPRTAQRAPAIILCVPGLTTVRNRLSVTEKGSSEPFLFGTHAADPKGEVRMSEAIDHQSAASRMRPDVALPAAAGRIGTRE